MSQDIFVGDANVFMHCRSLAEVDWSEVSQAAEVQVLVPSAVLRQIDDFKSRGNSRLARRSRKISGLLRKIVMSDEFHAVLRERSPRVVMETAPLLPSDRMRHPHLDKDNPDDQIIEEALAYQERYPDRRVRLLTDDSILMSKARQCRLSFVPVPESWRAEPEPDERDVKIAELQGKLKRFEADHPTIVISSEDVLGHETDVVDIEVVVYEQLSPGDIDILVDELASSSPMASSFEGHGKPLPRVRMEDVILRHGIGGSYRAPSEEDIRVYRERTYPGWLDEVRTYLGKVHQYLMYPSVTSGAAVFSLANVGGRPADGVIVEFRAYGELLLLPPRDEKAKPFPPAFPMPPEPPRAEWRGISSIYDLQGQGSRGLGPMYRPITMPMHDPRAWYWTGGRYHGMDVWTCTCDDFRHQLEAKQFRIGFEIPFGVPRIENGALECRVSARNLPTPVVKHVAFRISYAEADTVAAVRDLMPRRLPRGWRVRIESSDGTTSS